MDNNQFFLTTFEDERNYFWGDRNISDTSTFYGESQLLPSGDYRVIDGVLCRIISGLSQDEVRKRINVNAETET